MSFKRDGDDSGWLLSLQKRRVSELFATDIPADEAHLTKNGRIACLVCSHHPVFDTISMLAVHRNGRKHLTNAEYFLRNKRELEELKEIRRHEQYCDNGLVSVPVKERSLPATKHPLLVSTEYSSRVKHSKIKPYQRRSIVDLSSSSTETSQGNTAEGVKTVNSVNSIPESPASGYLADKSRREPDKTYCSSLSNESKHIDQHYRPFTDGQSSTNYQSNATSSKSKPTSQTKHLPYPDLKQWQSCAKSEAYRRRKLEREALGKNSSEKFSSVSFNVNKDCSNKTVSLSNRQVLPYESSIDNRTTVPTGNVKCEKTVVNVDVDSKSASHTIETACAGAVRTPSERSQLYLQAVSNGWKKSNDGSWVKDELAEFDSDDEPPTAL